MGAAPDTYRRLKGHARREIKIKGSRFIGEAWWVQDEAEASACLEEVRKREYNATHHCWAYRLGRTGDDFRYNDDGEPNGTAGQPILRQIDGRDLTQTLVVVTRYYGGTKLGTGGLIRAYGDAASDALDAGAIVVEVIREPVHIRFAYADTSPAMHTIDLFDAIIETSIYGDETELVVSVRASQVDAFRNAFVENLSGRGVLVNK